MDLINYSRRHCRPVTIGSDLTLGPGSPIAIQSMTSTSTMDTEASLAQIRRIAHAGAALVRLTAQGTREAENIGRMRPQVHVPLSADIHFNPAAAIAAAAVTDKVRINPGNFCRPGADIDTSLAPLLQLCKEKGTALRIGVNHGSLSPSIMERFGDTPEGMVESAMEYLRACQRADFHRIVVSIKASNVVVMVQTVRMLCQAMQREGLEYPLHIGVTEAGDGEDGRVKSAVGIGALLHQGIGDTIRVSLSEEPELEVPVARTLIDHVTARAQAPVTSYEFADGYSVTAPGRLPSEPVGNVGGGQPPVAWLEEIDAPSTITLSADEAATAHVPAHTVVLLTAPGPNAVGRLQAARHTLLRRGILAPVVMQLTYHDTDAETLAVKAAADFGALLLNGHADGISIISSAGLPTQALALSILQAARLRISKTEFISCPSCGRTMFDLQSTLRTIKAATSHLKGLKIGVMGCIVNGPGEMADADYGYVGAAAGRVSLYRRRQCVEKNIPQEQALDHLINLIKANGDWKEKD